MGARTHTSSSSTIVRFDSTSDRRVASSGSSTRWPPKRAVRRSAVITSGVQFLTDQLDISEAELSHFLRRTVVERRAGQEQVVLTTEEFRDAIDHDPDVRKEAGAATSLEFPGRSDGPSA